MYGETTLHFAHQMIAFAFNINLLKSSFILLIQPELLYSRNISFWLSIFRQRYQLDFLTFFNRESYVCTIKHLTMHNIQSV